MKPTFKIISLITIGSSLLTINIPARGSQTSDAAGVVLLQNAGARATAMGNAFTAVQNDVEAMKFNPATLASLEKGQASFQHEKGIADDAFNHLTVGSPSKKGSFGLSLGHYDGGKVDLVSNGTNRNVTAQRDIMALLGWARPLGRFSIGLGAKYISSELADSYSASTLAADAGMTANVSKNLAMGFSLQNLGGRLKYENDSEELPQTIQTGLAMTIPSLRSLLTMDGRYFHGDKDLQASIGLEVQLSLLALRVGYKNGAGENMLATGMGIKIDRFSTDYSVGFFQNANDLDPRHQISFAMSFGGEKKKPEIAKAEEQKKWMLSEVKVKQPE